MKISLIGPIRPIFLAVVVFLMFRSVFAHTAGDGLYPEAGLSERPGSSIPPDLTFSDEQGKRVVFGDLAGKPAILTLVYYSCSHVCPQMLGGLARALGDLRMSPGRDYSIITVSFDDSDTPGDALDLKRNYIKAAGRPFPEDAWRFLTGDRENIRKIADAAGVRFKKESHGFIHPEVLVFIAPGGKITGYLHVTKFAYGTGYPVTFSRVDLEKGLSEAALGKAGISSTRIPLYCFLHQPANQDRFFTVLKISGGVTLLLALALFVYLAKAKHA